MISSITKAAVPVSTVMNDRFTAMLRQLSRRIRKTRAPAATWVSPTVQAGSTSRPSTIGSSEPLTSRVSRRTSICSGNSSPARNAASRIAEPSNSFSGGASSSEKMITGAHSATDIPNISAATIGKTWLPV